MNTPPTHGKGDKPRPYKPDVYGRNFEFIKKACGCPLGTKCGCDRVTTTNTTLDKKDLPT
jgi:hypothetical protein